MSSPVEITANLNAFLNHFFGTESTALLPSLLKTTGGIIAGGSALWLTDPWCSLEYFMADVDIWIQDAPGLVRDHSVPRNKAYKDYMQDVYNNREQQMLRAFVESVLTRMGYIRDNSQLFSEVAAEYSTERDQNFKFINTIHNYKNPNITRKKVQVIYTNISPIEVVGKFDLTICQTYWDGRFNLNAKNYVQSFWPEHLKKRVFQNTSPLSANKIARETKYTKRGFSAYKEVEEELNEDEEQLRQETLVKEHFNKPILMDERLCKLLQLTPTNQYSRKDVICLMCNYIKSHNLQDPYNNKLILCNGPMFDLFGVHQLKYPELQKVLMPFYKTN